MKKLIKILIGFFLFVAFIGWFFKGESPTETQSSPPAVQRTGEYTTDLGSSQEYLTLGSSRQAESLLGIMETHPGKNKYQISYTTPQDVVLFGCDFEKNVLIRMHQRGNGTGTAEKWHGDLESRLRNAASGGSLNDTPTGKIPGDFQSF